MPKRTLQGVVVSDKQDKTVVVRVDRRFTHPIYKKTIRRSKNYHAHAEKKEFSHRHPARMTKKKLCDRAKVGDRGKQADLEVEALDSRPGREENSLSAI